MNAARILPVFLLLATVVTQVQAHQNGFGSSVAITDGALVVGKAYTGTGAGTVYVFGFDEASGDWVEHQQLQASDAGKHPDHFGRAMAGGGNTLFVGAIGSDDSRGAVYVFEQKDGLWAETAKLVASDGTEGYQFGNAVAVHGSRLLVSSVGPDETDGAVYVFDRDPDSKMWSERATIRVGEANPDDAPGWKRSWSGPAPVAGVGAALAIDDHMAVISVPAHGSKVLVYTHDPETDEWSKTGELTVEGLESRHLFGFALAVQDGKIFVSSAGFNGFQGAIFIFDQEGESGQWVESGRLSGVVSGKSSRMLGASLAVGETTLWTGAPFANDFKGTVFRYSRDAQSGDWLAVTEVLPEEIDADDSSAPWLGWTLNVNDNTALVGAPSADFGAGKAYVYEYAKGQWIETGALIDKVVSIPSVLGEEIACDGGVADRFACSEVDLVSFLSVSDLGGGRGMEVNDLWGWTDPETGKEWALIGRKDGTSFVDVSDPLRPVYVGNLPKTGWSPASTWRDIKVYKDHAFIVADGAGEHGMQVFDLRKLRDVQDPPTKFYMSAHYTGIASAHNIVITEETGFAFAVGSSGGGDTCGGGLHMIDIREPLHPTFAGCFADTETGRRGTGYSHDAQCVIYHGPDTEHRGKEICFSANEMAVSISDVTDKDEPVSLSNATYPNYGYSHQGWLTEDHHFFFMNDELDEIRGSVDGTRTLIWDVSDLDDPQLAEQYLSENKASDHNLYIRGDIMYQSNYKSGLRILDISDPLKPLEVGFFDTVPYGDNEPGLGGSWSNYPFFKSGIIVVTSGKEGMFILKKQVADT